MRGNKISRFLEQERGRCGWNKLGKRGVGREVAGVGVATAKRLDFWSRKL